MKKTLMTIGVLVLLSTGTSFCAPVSTASIIDKIENAIFGYTYSNENESLRLNRIEESVYGKTSTGSSTERLTKLKKDLSADLLGKEINPREDTFADESDIIVEKQMPQGPNVDYPAINELEKQVFNKEFKDKNLDDRLAGLEQKALGKTYKNDDFSSRVDRLRGELKPKSLLDNAIAQSSNSYYDDEPVQLSRDYGLQPYDSPNRFDYEAYNAAQVNNPYGFRQGGYYTDMGAARAGSSQKKVSLSAVENSIFKRTYPDDNTENRLARIENNMFGTTFNNDSQQERINRIGSAYKAQKSANKYDSNKFQQNITTGMQIGMFLLMILACVL